MKYTLPPRSPFLLSPYLSRVSYNIPSTVGKHKESK